jgi:pimeloyl-ACP methyl ester carboxylesterase
MRIARAALALALALAAGAALAADQLVTIDTRPGVRVSYWWMERPGAPAVLLLLTGGPGSIGYRNGVPTSENFLIRSRDRFAAAGFDVAIAGKPTDHDDLDLAFRASADHVADLKRVVDKLRADTGKPVWLVGTSRGTVSAAAAAIALGDSIAGVVLTSSITQAKGPYAVEDLDLARIKVPVLVMHHKRDKCNATLPSDASLIVDGLKNAPVKKLLMVDGGSGAHGDPCEPWHWHGYVGMEQEAVDAIVAFVRNPQPR